MGQVGHPCMGKPDWGSLFNRGAGCGGTEPGLRAASSSVREANQGVLVLLPSWLGCLLLEARMHTTVRVAEAASGP